MVIWRTVRELFSRILCEGLPAPLIVVLTTGFGHILPTSTHFQKGKKMKSLLSSACLTACLVAFGLVAAPAVAQSGSTGGVPAPSFNSGAISGPISSGFQGSGSVAPLPVQSFNPAPIQGGSGTVQPLPSINSGLSQGSGTAQPLPSINSGLSQGSGTVQPMPAFNSGVVQGSGTSAPMPAYAAPVYSQPMPVGQSFSSGQSFPSQPCCGGSAPVYSQPAPVYSQPAYSAPVYNQPVYSAPVYNRPIYTPFRGGSSCGCGG